VSRLATSDGAEIWWAPDVLPDIRPEMFDTGWLARQGYLRGTATGRGETYFLEIDGRALVLRHFRRGGLIGRLVLASYLRLGARRSRPFLEYHLLEWMHGEGLRVPRPVAARYAPSGPIYRAQLMTERIPGATPLADCLREADLPAQVWLSIGQTLRRLHALGVDHVDLNCRNILLDAEAGVWLIDFDRCRRRAPGRWAEGNLARLERSLVKEAGKQPVFFHSQAGWASLMRGYRGEGDAT